MARTPLFHLLQRAARIARASTHAGMPLDEFQERGDVMRTDLARRRLLQGAAAGLALTACAPATQLVAPTGNDPVAIVGAGIAGLTAAWRLRQAGVPVRIFEAQERIGGRMFSLRNYFREGHVAELGGELIDTGHVRIRALAATLGLVLDDLLAGETDVDVYFFDGRRITEREIVAAFVPVARAIERDVASLGDGSLDDQDANPAFHALDTLSIAQWLDRNDVQGWLRELIDVAYTTEMGLAIDRQSALNLLTFIGTDDADAFHVFGESDERFHVRDGNDQIPRLMAARMPDAIATGHVLEAVRADGRGVRLSFRVGSATQDVRASQVVLALPFTLLREVSIGVPLPPGKRRAIDALPYGTNAKLMIGYDSRVWRTQGANGATLSDLAYQTTWETTRKQGGTRGVLTNFTGGAHGIALGEGTARMQADAATAELDRLFPGIVAARGEDPREARFQWPSHPWSRGSYACFGPGDWSRLRGAIAAPVGPLFFAGEHCARDAQGFMEGGCESGDVAAEAVLAARGIRERAALFPIQTRRIRIIA